MSRRKRIEQIDEIIEVRMPLEERVDHRIATGHTQSEWKFKQIWYGHRCGYCGVHKDDTPEGYLTRDHIIPISEGGDDNIENIVPACRQCNFAKGKELPEKFGLPRVRKRRRKR